MVITLLQEGDFREAGKNTLNDLGDNCSIHSQHYVNRFWDKRLENTLNLLITVLTLYSCRNQDGEIWNTRPLHGMCKFCSLDVDIKDLVLANYAKSKNFNLIYEPQLKVQTSLTAILQKKYLWTFAWKSTPMRTGDTWRVSGQIIGRVFKMKI